MGKVAPLRLVAASCVAVAAAGGLAALLWRRLVDSVEIDSFFARGLAPTCHQEEGQGWRESDEASCARLDASFLLPRDGTLQTIFERKGIGGTSDVKLRVGCP